MNFDSLQPWKQPGDHNSSSSEERTAVGVVVVANQVIPVAELEAALVGPSRSQKGKKTSWSIRKIFRSEGLTPRPPGRAQRQEQLQNSNRHGLVGAAATGQAATGRANQSPVETLWLESKGLTVGVKARCGRKKKGNFLDLSLALPPYHFLNLHVQGLHLSVQRWPSVIHDDEFEDYSNYKEFLHFYIARSGEFMFTYMYECTYEP